MEFCDCNYCGVNYNIDINHECSPPKQRDYTVRLAEKVSEVELSRYKIFKELEELRKTVNWHLSSFDEYGDSDWQSVWKSMIELKQKMGVNINE